MNGFAMDMTSRSIPILMIGLNHKVAPVEVRERLAFGPERLPSILHEVMEDGNSAGQVIKEAILLSTCNRTEAYILACDSVEAERELQEFFARQAGLPVEELQCMEYVARGQEAALHLMQVSAGRGSLVLGEEENIGQGGSVF